MRKCEVENLLRKVLVNPVAYHRIYAEITEGVTSGLLLSQLFYWDKVMHGSFWKTDRSFCEELSMGFGEFRGAKSKLKKLGYISTKRVKTPARTQYTLNKTLIFEEISRLAKNSNLACENPIHKTAKKAQSITETNPKITSEITKTTEKISSQELLALDLRISAEKKLFMREIEKIFRLNQREGVTFARITKHLVDIVQEGKKDIGVFKDAIEWARQAKASTARNQKGLFVAKIKEATGFTKQEKLLSK